MPEQTAAPPLEARALAGWPAADRAAIAGYMSRRACPSGPAMLSDPGWWVVTSGQARLLGDGATRALGPGDDFGAEALARGGAPDVLLTADEPIGLAHLSMPRFHDLAAERPALALALLQATWPAARDDAPASAHARVRLTLPDGEAHVAAGTPLAAVLPATVAGRPVVAATIDRKVVSLDTPAAGDAAVAPLTEAEPDGRAALVRSLGLVLLEAAHVAMPRLVLQLGSRSGRRQAVHVVGDPGLPLADLAARLDAAMRTIVAAHRPFRREIWTLEQATMGFADQGWDEVVELLRTWRDATVTVASCGGLAVLAMGPFAPHTGLLGAFALRATDDGLELALGDRAEAGPHAPPPPHRPPSAWLDVLGVRDLGGRWGSTGSTTTRRWRRSSSGSCANTSRASSRATR